MTFTPDIIKARAKCHNYICARSQFHVVIVTDARRTCHFAKLALHGNYIHYVLYTKPDHLKTILWEGFRNGTGMQSDLVLLVRQVYKLDAGHLVTRQFTNFIGH